MQDERELSLGCVRSFRERAARQGLSGAIPLHTLMFPSDGGDEKPPTLYSDRSAAPGRCSVETGFRFPKIGRAWNPPPISPSNYMVNFLVRASRIF